MDSHPRVLVSVGAFVNALILICAICMLLTYRATLMGWPIERMGNLGSLCAAIALLTVWRVSPHGIWSPSVVYLGVLIVFHLGLTSLLGLGLLSDRAMDLWGVDQWLWRDSTVYAAWVSFLGVLACALGINVNATIRRPLPPRAPVEADRSGSLLSLVGGALVAGSVAFWLLAIERTGGLGMLFGSYQEYLAATGESGLASWFVFIQYAMGLGMAFLAAAPRTRWTKVGVIAFAFVFVPLGLPIGLRGEIMVPALTALVILSLRGWRLSGRASAIALVGVFAVVNLISTLRSVGLTNAREGGVQASPFDAIAELGASLRPVSEVVLWRQLGEPFIHGASYWAPFDRAFGAISRDPNRLPSALDDRLLNSLVDYRVGQIGFSTIAEAYRNFSVPGVLIVLGLFGLLVGRMDSWPNTPGRLALLGVIYVELLLYVRNAWTSVPSHIVMGMLVLAAVLWVGQHRATRPAPRPLHPTHPHHRPTPPARIQ